MDWAVGVEEHTVLRERGGEMSKSAFLFRTSSAPRCILRPTEIPGVPKTHTSEQFGQRSSGSSLPLLEVSGH